MKIINPATEEVIGELTPDDAAAVAAKLGRLREGQRAWVRQPLAARLECLARFGALVKEKEQVLAETLTAETGKPCTQALNEIRGAAGRITHLLEHAERWLSPEKMGGGETEEWIHYEPLGVIGNISAWNYPYNVGYNVFLYALAAGNAVLYKPSEYAAGTGAALTALLHEAGVPADVFACVQGGPETGALLLDSPLDGYFFTGSYRTGAHIAARLAGRLVPLQLELGGKDPLYVAGDVPDIARTAAAVAEGAFYNAGQSCCAVERIYVQEQIHDAFLEAFVAEVKGYRVGDPRDPATFIGPVTRKAQLELIQAQIADALAKGARLCCGGGLPGGPGYFMEPAVLAEVDHRMALMKEESFGPVVGIQRVRDDAEALALMADTDYGLTAAVYSADRERAEKILAQLQVGTAYWNCCDRVSPALPWSGRKHSGIGSTLSYQGIRAFTQPKGYHLRRP